MSKPKFNLHVNKSLVKSIHDNIKDNKFDIEVFHTLLTETFGYFSDKSDKSDLSYILSCINKEYTKRYKEEIPSEVLNSIIVNYGLEDDPSIPL